MITVFYLAEFVILILQRVIQKCGGYRNFILRSKDLAVVDKIVAAKADLRNAQELAFKVCILLPDVQIVVQPGSLAARNYLSWQK